MNHIDIYKFENNGELPSDWNDLLKYPSLKRTLDRYPFNFTEHYQFAPDGLKVKGEQSGRVIIIGSIPKLKLQGDKPGRFIIWESEDGRLQETWFYENEIQDMFGAAGLKLAEATNNTEPARMYTTEQKSDKPDSIESKEVPKTVRLHSLPTPKAKTDNQSIEVTENQPTQSTVSFPWLFVIVGLILLAVIAVVGFKVLGKSS